MSLKLVIISGSKSYYLIGTKLSPGQTFLQWYLVEYKNQEEIKIVPWAECNWFNYTWIWISSRLNFFMVYTQKYVKWYTFVIELDMEYI